ncbi:hypothetical protein JTE90_029402 [Oedothorax gibbosus]|uniref:Uncharacterized protein n=1 Tax=Oedothorax gibbosus TaxID=931172 RepID=A0AAV6UCR3_9ARAC|nr:hypothetical protein JTE90_029402 [Oedothorax gibbosus]
MYAGVGWHQRWVRPGDVRWSWLASEMGEAGRLTLELAGIRDGVGLWAFDPTRMVPGEDPIQIGETEHKYMTSNMS